MVCHADVSRSGADSFAVLIPTSLVDATFQEAIVVVEISKAVVERGSKRLVVAISNLVGHFEEILPILPARNREVWLFGLVDDLGADILISSHAPAGQDAV